MDEIETDRVSMTMTVEDVETLVIVADQDLSLGTDIPLETETRQSGNPDPLAIMGDHSHPIGNPIAQHRHPTGNPIIMTIPDQILEVTWLMTSQTLDIDPSHRIEPRTDPLPQGLTQSVSIAKAPVTL